MFNPFDEFPHTIEIGEVEVVGTIDTATSSETFKFQQMDKD
ncbi:hypothetical protein JMUB7497_27170 [Staphylococcus aureus]